ncbi:MAG TPA: DUF3613 domain-containing protein [Paraburkholderia sp.]
MTATKTRGTGGGCGRRAARAVVAWAGVALAIGVAGEMGGIGGIGVAAAQSSASAAPRPVRASEVGHATAAWLELQRSNSAAAPTLPMLGVEAGFAYQRYIESFKTKIPASFGSSMDSGYSGNQPHVDYSNSGAPQN